MGFGLALVGKIVDEVSDLHVGYVWQFHAAKCRQYLVPNDAIGEYVHPASNVAEGNRGYAAFGSYCFFFGLKVFIFGLR